MKILCIEDNDIKYGVIEKLLQPDNEIELIQARNGNEGLSKLSREEFDLLILDMSLPINNHSKDTNMLYGKDVLAEIKRMRRHFKVFIITGFDYFEQDKEKLSFNELNKKLMSEYQKYLVDMVHYDQLSIEWANVLKQVIEELKRN